jgi:phage-related protein
VLTAVKAYSSWRSAPELPLNGNRAETDFLQVRNIDGLDPVKASVSTSPFGAIDGASYVGSSVLSRNILMTIHPNPDWYLWSFEALRRLLYSYFMPKRETRLVFSSDDMDPVEISGIVESVEVNMFSKDQEFIVSIICPEPYFTSVDPKVITGQAVRAGGAPTIVDYDGTIEAGMKLKLTTLGTPYPTDIGIQIGNPRETYFAVTAGISTSMYFEMSSVPMKKYVQNVDMSTAVITNLLSKVYIQEGSYWPMLQPGENEVTIITNQGNQDWELTVYELFGGL